MVLFLDEDEWSALKTIAARGLAEVAHSFPHGPTAAQIEELANCGGVYRKLLELKTDEKPKVSDSDVSE